MDALDRNITAGRGARFFRGDDGEVQFEFVLDPTNRIGPRPALRIDQDKHAEAWAAFAASEGAAGPLDRDADQAPGGSLPAAEPLRIPVEFDEAQVAPIATVEQVAPRTRAKRARRA